MKLTWSTEKNCHLTLRDESGAARAIIKERDKDLSRDFMLTQGWVGTVLERGMPSVGPFMSRHDACVALQDLFAKLKIFDACEFGEIPEREVSHADQEHDSGAVDRGS